jgi:hypothetical protein
MKRQNILHRRISDNEISLPSGLEINAMKALQPASSIRTGRHLTESVAMVGIAVLCAVSGNVFAAQTTGGVNWIDPLAYQKPEFISIAVPDEATVSNKYWVNMSGGSGSTCSMASPCASIDNVMGKPGTTGGPAYVYVKGSGPWSGYNDTFYGSAGNEIVIKPWPAGSTGCPSECSATFTANSNANSSSIRYLIFDGGPNLNLAFTSSGGDQYNFHVIANNITFYRIRAYATTGGSMLFAVGDTSNVTDVKFINSEFYGCNQQAGYQCSAVYWGPGSTGGFTNNEFKNNIVRDMGGDGVEVNPRVPSSGLEISGNAFHNIGKQTCTGNWLCRPAITLNSQNGQSNPNVTVKNNLMWDIASSCIWARSPGSNQVIYNNTCYDYGKVSPDTNSSPNPEGISGGNATNVSNNIIYAPNGVNPFDSSYSGSNNLCGSGKSCGSSSRVWSANTMLATDQNTSNFMRIGSSSEASNSGYAIPSVARSYDGRVRPPYDIGAFGSGTTGGLQAPSNLTVVP